MEVGQGRLGRQDWIDAGLRALAAGGVEAVRIDPLAKVLGVTRGSFYWHFADRDALLGALLNTWKARETDDAIATVEHGGGPPSERLLRLLELCAEDDGRLETSLRAWSVKDGAVAAEVVAVDRRRVAYLEALLRGLGLHENESAARARLVYRAWIGAFMLLDARTRPERLADARHTHRLVTAAAAASGSANRP